MNEKDRDRIERVKAAVDDIRSKEHALASAETRLDRAEIDLIRYLIAVVDTRPRSRCQHGRGFNRAIKIALR